jgi:hypothetical protein
MKFIKIKKRPVEVEGFQLTKEMLHTKNFKFSVGSRSIYILWGVFCIETLEGVMKAKVGDWIIKGIKGEIYPCRKDIFEETYDLLEESSN